MDPSLAGPSLGMTSGQMAQPGMMHTAGRLTPQMVASVHAAGRRSDVAGAAHAEADDAIRAASLDIERREDLAQAGQGRSRVIGKIVAGS